MFNTHVYLGPSLDMETAMCLLPEAHYHPPIQCGDIIRLLRIEPQRIVIIDGLYEHVPAVWHKEIMLALELGVEVWGAASMGALRAAELHPYGMRGVGEAFHAYKTGALCDDDEVAVLHQGKENGYIPINDAMISIRATCAKALEAGVIDLEIKEHLISFCKNQFYPYRSLNRAIQSLSLDNPTYKAIGDWYAEHGMVNVKRNDAMLVLKTIAATFFVGTKTVSQTPMTIFLNELTQYVNVTPFSQQDDWLPEKEKHLQILYNTSRPSYRLVAEIAYFAKKLNTFASEGIFSMDKEALLDYIHQNHLYSPEADFLSFKNHAVLSDVFMMVCQSICMQHLSIETMNQYISAMIHYYDLDAVVAKRCAVLLRVLCALMLSINMQLNKYDSALTKKTIVVHLSALSKSRHYNKSQFNQWINPVHIDATFFMNFVSIYVKIARAYTNKIKKEKVYFNWIYDAVSLYS